MLNMVKKQRAQGRDGRAALEASEEAEFTDT